MRKFGELLSKRPRPSADLALGNPVAANGWSARRAPSIRFEGRAADRVLRHPDHIDYTPTRSGGRGGRI